MTYNIYERLVERFTTGFVNGRLYAKDHAQGALQVIAQTDPHDVRAELERLNAESEDIMDMSRGLIAFFSGQPSVTPAPPRVEWMVDRDGKGAVHIRQRICDKAGCVPYVPAAEAPDVS